MSANIRAMLKRVQVLEQARQAPKSPIEVAYGSMDAYAEEAEAEIAAGKLDGRDFPIILDCLRKWHADHVWQGFKYRRGRPEFGS